jgi:glycosyltransferase involved in cell wall biosynthesis
MKVMIVAPYYYPKVGGLENYARGIAENLTKNGHNVFVVSTNHEGKKIKTEKIDGIKVIRLPIAFTLSNTPFNLNWRKQMKKIIETEKPDIINAHTPVPFISDISTRVADKIPVVLTYHNDLVKPSGLGKYLAKLCYLILINKTMRKATTIIVTSEFYADSSPYLAKYRHKLGITPPGVDISHFNGEVDKKWLKDRYPSKKIVLFAGNMDKSNSHKGVDVLIKSLASLRNRISNVQVVAVGRGDAIEDYKRLAKEYNVGDLIDFVGFVKSDELPKYFAGADVVTLPSINESEGFGMVIIEAAACGTPAVGSKVGGVPFAIKDKQTGILVSPGSKAELTSALADMLKSAKTLRIYGKAAQKRATSEYSWDKISRQTEDIFKRAVLPNICLIHNVISPYRLPVYECVNKQVNMTVLFCKPITKDRVWTYDLSKYTFRYEVLKHISLGPIIFNLNIIQALKRAKFDVIMVNSDPDIAPSALTGLLYAKFSSKKALIWSLSTDDNVHFFPALAYSSQPIKRMLRSILSKTVMIYRRICFSMADHFLAFSKQAKLFLEEQGISKALISLTPQIMPIELLPEPRVNHKRNGHTFLYIGYFNERKGISYLIDAFMKLADKDAQLILAGSGPTERALKRQARLDKRIKFYGYVEGTDKANLYAKADIFVLPTLLDVWGLVINEAIRYGLAIICSDSATAKEIISKKSGLIFESTNIADLYTKMLELTQNQTRLRQLQDFNSNFADVTSTSRAATGYVKAMKETLS